MWLLENVAFRKVTIFKTKLLAGNDHVIGIFTSEDMEKISRCIFSILLSTIYNKSEYPAAGYIPAQPHPIIVYY